MGGAAEARPEVGGLLRGGGGDRWRRFEGQDLDEFVLLVVRELEGGGGVGAEGEGRGGGDDEDGC